MCSSDLGLFPFPAAVASIWIDVRDLAVAIVEGVLRPEVGNTRFVLAAPEGFSYQREADILRETFDWAKDVVAEGNKGEPAPEWPKGEGEKARTMLGIGKYRTFRETIVDAIGQFKDIQRRQSQA